MTPDDNLKVLDALANTLGGGRKSPEATAAAKRVVLAGPAIVLLAPNELARRLAALERMAKPVLGAWFNKLLLDAPRAILSDPDELEVRNVLKCRVNSALRLGRKPAVLHCSYEPGRMRGSCECRVDAAT